MGEHVDVVLNDYAREVQTFAATVIFDGEQLIVKDAIDTTTENTVTRLARTAMLLDRSNPLPTFARLMSDGDLFAMDPHVSGCPFSSGVTEIPMEHGDFDAELAAALDL